MGRDKKEPGKKEPVKKEAQEDDLGRKSIMDREVYKVLITMGVLVIVFVSAYYFFGSLNTFEYKGLTFTKEKFGEIPVFRYYYYFNADNGELIQYNLYLRNDPRDNFVSITGRAVDQGIYLPKRKTTYISISPGALDGCEYGLSGISTLAIFLSDNQISVKGASTDKERAEADNLKHVTCETHPNNVVIEIREGNETEIIHNENNCYVIRVNECQIVEAVEKFQVQSILDAKGSV